MAYMPRRAETKRAEGGTAIKADLYNTRKKRLSKKTKKADVAKRWISFLFFDSRQYSTTLKGGLVCCGHLKLVYDTWTLPACPSIKQWPNHLAGGGVGGLCDFEPPKTFKFRYLIGEGCILIYPIIISISCSLLVYWTLDCWGGNTLDKAQQQYQLLGFVQDSELFIPISSFALKEITHIHGLFHPL